jgi:type VI secretion system protein VasD
MMPNTDKKRFYGKLRGIQFLLVGLVTVTLLSVGCASSGPPPVINIGIDVKVSADLNPDQNGRPSPLVLAIYQLKSADDFRNKDFFTVFDPGATALGTDLLRREQITLQPGVDQALAAEFDPQTEFVGVVGAFSDIENSQWRAVVPLPEGELKDRIKFFKSNRLTITVGERTVSIAVGG